VGKSARALHMPGYVSSSRIYWMRKGSLQSGELMRRGSRNDGVEGCDGCFGGEE
jgi:hypothetical protein